MTEAFRRGRHEVGKALRHRVPKVPVNCGVVATGVSYKPATNSKAKYLQFFFFHLVSADADKAADVIPAGSIDLKHRIISFLAES